MNKPKRDVQVWAIVPAAGRGRRVGGPKQLLPYRESTLVGTVTQTLLDARIDRVVVVTRPPLVDALRLPKDPRVAIAKDFVDRFEYGVPMLVDSMDNAAEEAYAGWPERLYVIDESGTVVYKGGVGPMKFDPNELEEFLAAIL